MDRSKTWAGACVAEKPNADRDRARTQVPLTAPLSSTGPVKSASPHFCAKLNSTKPTRRLNSERNKYWSQRYLDVVRHVTEGYWLRGCTSSSLGAIFWQGVRLLSVDMAFRVRDRAAALARESSWAI